MNHTTQLVLDVLHRKLKLPPDQAIKLSVEIVHALHIKEVVNAMQSVHTDCSMALDGAWDRSDDGFMATRDSMEAVLNKLGAEIPEYEVR